MIGHSSNNVGLSFIDFDFESAVMTAFEHLVTLNHQNIGFVTMKPDSKRERYGPTIRAAEGHEKACTKYELPRFKVEADNGLENVKEATMKMLKNHPEITAIVSVSDMAVAGIFEAIHDPWSQEFQTTFL